MSDYTPSAQTIKDVWIMGGAPFTSPSQRSAEFDRAIEKVRAEAKAEALLEAVDDLTDVVEGIQSSGSPNSLGWQTGALAMRDRLKIRAYRLVTDE